MYIILVPEQERNSAERRYNSHIDSRKRLGRRRGILSWEYRCNHRRLDEAGSYGEDLHIAAPSRLLPQIERDGIFTLTICALGTIDVIYRICGVYRPKTPSLPNESEKEA